MHSSAVAKTLALSVAIVAHGALAMTLSTRPAPVQEGGTGTLDVRLGNAFEDMSAGTLSAVQPDRTKTAEPNETIQAKPVETPRTSVTAVFKTSEPVPLTPAPRPPALHAALPKTARAASAPKVTTPDAAKDTVKSIETSSAAVERSPRPQHLPAARPTPQPTAQAPAPRGDAPKTSRAGTAQGHENASARQSGDRGRQQSAGNAAANTYPGEVMRTLSRAGKPRIEATEMPWDAQNANSSGLSMPSDRSRSSRNGRPHGNLCHLSPVNTTLSHPRTGSVGAMSKPATQIPLYFDDPPCRRSDQRQRITNGLAIGASDVLIQTVLVRV